MTAINITGLDATGEPVSLDFDGWPARIMQHETDHLNGTLYVDRMLTRSLAGEEELARLSALPVAEVVAELVATRERR
jgi:peptide deformylase